MIGGRRDRMSEVTQLSSIMHEPSYPNSGAAPRLTFGIYPGSATGSDSPEMLVGPPDDPARILGRTGRSPGRREAVHRPRLYPIPRRVVYEAGHEPHARGRRAVCPRRPASGRGAAIPIGQRRCQRVCEFRERQVAARTDRGQRASHRRGQLHRRTARDRWYVPARPRGPGQGCAGREGRGHAPGLRPPQGRLQCGPVL